MAYVITRGERHTGYYRDRNGMRYSAGTFETKAEALARAQSAESCGNIGGYRLTMTLREYIHVWLPKADLLPMTKKSYESVLANHVLPVLGKKKVGDITRPQVRDLLKRLAHEGVSASVRVHAKSALGSALRELVEDDLLDVNPTHKVTVKQPARKFRSVLEPSEFKRVQEKLPTPTAKLFAQFLVVSGCRFGEATELRVKDVDYSTGDIYVERRASDLGGERNEGSRFLVVEGTKGGAGRMVRVTEAMTQSLEKHAYKNKLKEDDLLFSKTLVTGKTEEKPVQPQPVGEQHGTRYSYTRLRCRCDACRKANADYQKTQRRMKSEPVAQHKLNVTDHLPRDTWRRVWAKAVKQAGLRWEPRTHDLRHANATLLLKNGVDLHEVKERLGHSSISTTEGYLHRLRHQASKAADAVGDFL